MAEASSQTTMDQNDLSDYSIAILGALVFGATVGAVVFGLIAGYEYAANEFLNIYPPDDSTVDFWIGIAYTWSPVIIGLFSTIPAYRFLLKLK